MAADRSRRILIATAPKGDPVEQEAEVERYMRRWRLKPDGAPIVTHSSRLRPVLFGGMPAMLKVAFEKDEREGFVLLDHWDGDGAAAVFDRDGAAILMERATGDRSLTVMAQRDGDDTASRIMVMVAARLHVPRPRPPPELTPLSQWFRELWPRADADGGRLAAAAAMATELLANQREITTLHGDIHHANILDFGEERGWLAIDPKHIIGDRAFDFANIFTDPDFATATRPGRLAGQVRTISEAASIEPLRLLRWIVAWTGLSAAWWLGDGIDPVLDFAVFDLASAELAK